MSYGTARQHELDGQPRPGWGRRYRAPGVSNAGRHDTTARRIRNLRYAAGLSIEQLAEQTRLTVARIHELEQAISAPTIIEAIALAPALGTTASTLA